MKDIDLLILGWHQVYLSSNAGGYVRLKEFLKRVPHTISFLLLDNEPSIFTETVDKSTIITYDTPKIIKPIRNKFFLIWLLLETITAGYTVYKMSKTILRSKHPKVLYVPIGEFPQLYLPAVFLKRKYPNLKLVVDILNYEMPERNACLYFKKLRKSGIGIVRNIITLVMYYIGFLLTKSTLSTVDYIFTVSPELVKSIKKSYKKDSIDFTPSGINSSKKSKRLNKKFLAVYVGRVTAQKGILELLEVWKHVVEKQKDAKLAIAGVIDEQTKRRLQESLLKMKLQKNIILFGEISEREKNEILLQSEVFLHLARYEPLFPVIGTLEGYSCGLPVIVYNMPVVSSQKILIASSGCTFVVPNGDTVSAAKKIIKYAALSDTQKKEIAKKAEHFASKYDWDIIANKEFSIITQLIFSKKKYK